MIPENNLLLFRTIIQTSRSEVDDLLGTACRDLPIVFSSSCTATGSANDQRPRFVISEGNRRFNLPTSRCGRAGLTHAGAQTPTVSAITLLAVREAHHI